MTTLTSHFYSQKSAYELSIQRWRDRQKPVKERNLKLYKIISVIAIIAFFPLGIPAFYHSMKLQEEFYDGIQKGNEFNGILRFCCC